MRILRRILAPIVWLFKLMGRGVSRGVTAIISARPSRIKISVATGRTVAAPLWRKLIHVAMVLAGLGIYIVLQYGLARLIISEQFYQIMLVGVAVISFILSITRPALAYAVWIVVSPFGALFLGEAVAGRIALSFDRVVLMLLVIILTCRALINRHAPRKLLAGEWLLVCATIYTYVLPLLIGRWPIIYMVNNTTALAVTPLTMYFVTKSSIKNRRQLYWLILAFYIMGMLWAGSGVYEHFTGRSWMNPITQAGWGVEAGLRRHDVSKGRAAGPTEHYYTYGEVLSLAVLLAFHFSIWTKQPAAKLFYYASMVFMTIALYYGYSRAPIIAFIGAILLMPLIARNSRKQYIGLALALLLAAAAIFPVVATDPTLKVRFLSPGGALYARQIMMASGINLIKQNFWLGVGVGNMPKTLSNYLADPHHQKSSSGLYLRPHNDYVVVLGEQGIFGFIFFFGAIAALLRAALRTRASLPPAGILGKDSVSIVIMFALMHAATSLADEFQAIQYSTYVLFTLLAIAVRLGELHDDDNATDEAMEETKECATSLRRSVVA